MTTIFGERLGGLLARRAANKAGDFLVPAAGQIGLSLAADRGDDPASPSPALAHPIAHAPNSGFGTSASLTGLSAPDASCHSPAPAAVAVAAAPVIAATAAPVAAPVALHTTSASQMAQPIIRETIVQQHIIHEQPLARVTNLDNRVLNVDQRVQNVDNRETHVTQTILQRITANGPVNQTIGAGVVSGDGATAIGPVASAAPSSVPTALDPAPAGPAKPIDQAEHNLDLAFGKGALVGDETLPALPTPESATQASSAPAPEPGTFSSPDDVHVAPTEGHHDEHAAEDPAEGPVMHDADTDPAHNEPLDHGPLDPEADDSLDQHDAD